MKGLKIERIKGSIIISLDGQIIMAVSSEDLGQYLGKLKEEGIQWEQF